MNRWYKNGLMTLLLMLSPLAYGHLSVDHSANVNATLIHYLTDPVHVTILTIVLMLLVIPVLPRIIDVVERWIVSIRTGIK